jgi:hypothetical protein
VAIGGALLLALVTANAEAWGPKAQRAITQTAMQRLNEKMPLAFDTKAKESYRGDVINGAVDGVQSLITAMNIRTEKDAVELIGNQIILLREMRKNGIGSYFAYRMGLLSSIVSDVMLPYSLDPTPGTEELRARMEKDIDDHVFQYRFLPEGHLQVVGSVPRYLDAYRPFYTDAKRLIAEDYRTGAGYGGYLSQAGQSFFGEAVQATADVWYTILRESDAATDVKPSPEAITWYLENEMEYLVKVKRNVPEAEKKYTLLERENPGIPEVYERVGDLYFAYGNATNDRDLRERAVKEWETALDMPRAERTRLSDKLAGYYLDLGKNQVEAARQPGGYKRITDALASFSRALEYSRDNADAEKLLADTRTLKRELDEAMETQTNIINSAEQVMRQADQSEKVQDYNNALTWYGNAHDLFSKVTGQFPELKQAADERTAEIQRRINTIKEEAIKRARETIAKGDQALEAKSFQDAIDTYGSVDQILSPITDEPTTPHGKRRDELKNTAQQKIRQADDAKAEDERQKAAAAEAAKNAAKGGAAVPGIK